MDVQLAAVCDFASVTENGKLNILGVFDKVLSPGTPCVHESLFYVARISMSAGDPDRVAFELRIVDADGQLATPPVGVETQRHEAPQDGEPQTVQLALQILRAEFRDFGAYTFELRGNGRHLRDTVLQVVQAQASPPG